MEAVFGEIITMSLSASVLAAVVLVLRLCLRKTPKWVHCALWALVAVRLVCPSLPQSQLSMVPPPVVQGPVLEEGFFLSSSPEPEKIQEKEVDWGNIPAPVQPEALESPIPWGSILAWIWLAGIGVMGLYALWSCRRILKRVGPSVHTGDGVYLCDYIDTPFLLGLWRPRIYLPSQLDAGTAEFVLAHERSHIRRRDHWWKPIGFTLLSIHWFNPVIWLSYVLLCRDIEMACDEAVIRTLGKAGKQGYSEALLRCSLPRSTIAICPLAFGEIGVKDRIQSVLRYRKPALWLTALGLAAVIGGAVFFLTDPVEEAPIAETTAATEAVETEPTAPFAEELAQMKPNPPRIRKDEVEYFQTAIYTNRIDSENLIVIQYDENFRVKKETTYDNGEKQKDETFQYFGDDNTLFTIVSMTTTAESGTSFSGDGWSIGPRQTLVLTYREEFDEKGNVLEQLTYAGNQLVCTKIFTYDQYGNQLTSFKEQDTFTSQIDKFYDDQGHIVREIHYAVHTDDGRESEFEYWHFYDENGFLEKFQRLDKNGRGYTETYINDAEGNPLTMEDVGSNGQGRVFCYKYDKGQNLEIKESRQLDGTSPYREVIQYDGHRNHLRSIHDETMTIKWAHNYIGTDGSRSIGIPREIFDEGFEEVPMPTLNLAPIDYAEDEVKDLCLNALRDYLMHSDRKVLITDEAGTAELIQSGQDYRYFRTPNGAQAPDLALLRRNGMTYQENEEGLWTPVETAEDPLLWYQEFLYNRDQLTFLSEKTQDNVREITYDAGGDTITYCLEEDALVGLRKSGSRNVEVSISRKGLSMLYDLFEREEKRIVPTVQEDTAPFLTHPEEIEAYNACMDALNALQQEPFYQVDTAYSCEAWLTGYRTVHRKLDNNLLYERYAEGATLPLESQGYLDGLYYKKYMGDWVFDSPLPNTESFDWDSHFRFALADATAIRIVGQGSQREITFDLPYRPGQEEEQRNHKITFCLNGTALTGIHEEGILSGQSQFRYETSLTCTPTNRREIQKQFQKADVTKCRDFDWEKDLAAAENSLEGTFPTSNVTIRTPQDAFRYAPREHAGEYSWVQVYRDQKANMWKVEFCKMDGSSKIVYLNDNGEVKLALARKAVS